MSSKNIRRSVSMSGNAYDVLKRYCEENDNTMSGVVEELTRVFLGMPERIVPGQQARRPIKPPVKKKARARAKKERPMSKRMSKPARGKLLKERVAAMKTGDPVADQIFTF